MHPDDTRKPLGILSLIPGFLSRCPYHLRDVSGGASEERRCVVLELARCEVPIPESRSVDRSSGKSQTLVFNFRPRPHPSS
jgi:hypothetical protein